MIGKALTEHLLDKGYKVVIVSRRKINPSKENVGYAWWDVDEGRIDESAIKDSAFIIHLAGAGVADKRWSKKRKQEIVESRIKSSALLVKALQEIPNNVKAVVSSSAIGWYGPDPIIPNHKPFEENALPKNDFLGNTCKAWEESIEPIANLSIRLVKLRTGIVLSNNGGALVEFKKPIKGGVAAILGSGKQVVSWIHIDDLCRLYIQAMENSAMRGVYNAVAPHPVNNKALTMHLAKAIKGSFFIAVNIPSFMLKLALGEMSIEVLKSTTVSAAKVKESGFHFVYPTIEAAVNNLTSN